MTRGNRQMRLAKTPKRLRMRGQTDARKCRHIKAKRVQPGMVRVGARGDEKIVEVKTVGTRGVSVYTDRFPGGLYYNRNSLVPVQ